jgi:2,3-bisphosphoglycerate-independent phosphoglycerate mutase
VIDAMGGVALITADHGNADEMYELDKKTKQPAQNRMARSRPRPRTR